MRALGALVGVLILAFPGGCLAKSLQEANPGDIVPRSWKDLPAIHVKQTAVANAQLVLSNSPETFLDGQGLAAQEKVEPGRPVRLYLWHVPFQVPSGHPPRTISFAVKNLNDNAPMRLAMKTAASATGGNPFEIGKTLFKTFFEQSRMNQGAGLGKTITFKPGEARALDDALDGSRFSGPWWQVVGGFYEFTVDQPALITTFQRGPGTSSAQAPDSLPALPMGWGQHPRPTGNSDDNGAGRGLMDESDIDVTVDSDREGPYDPESGPAQFVLAANWDSFINTDQGRVTWIRGRDGLSRQDTKNFGDFAVVYHIRLAWKSSHDKKLALLAFDPDAAEPACAKHAGVFRVSLGAFPEGVVAAPAQQGPFKGDSEAVLLQKFGPSPSDGVRTMEIDFSPFGPTCSATGFALVPF